ncbi:immunity 63 family protein [Paenibacillus sp. EKM202P]|uniref:immunity 63 family protein n=1 Tax=unclassified Paenibacillus TaxID=185978 RepID=UPI0013EBA97B|nr:MULTISPECIES: immunity 63 family protein [unclassified Paenibacillus]KAF6561226.1 immunity 63 family protein [Paenibacillus sp. EKM202P]KAF6566138.1 immunity 63 family protein [Paenibacillus sp. EKM207P]
MKKIYREQEIIDMTIKLLEQTSMYEEQYEQYVRRPFRTDFYDDLSPYVKVGKQGYTLQMYERGVQMLNKLTQDVEDVMYWIIEDTIHIIAHLNLLRKYKVDNQNTHLKYTKEIMKELTTAMNNAFYEIGGIYQVWHEANRRAMLENPLK